MTPEMTGATAMTVAMMKSSVVVSLPRTATSRSVVHSVCGNRAHKSVDESLQPLRRLARARFAQEIASAVCAIHRACGQAW